jgi:hypothetical protein
MSAEKPPFGNPMVTPTGTPPTSSFLGYLLETEEVRRGADLLLG